MSTRSSHQSSPFQGSVYSAELAAEVVEDFTAQYARATEFIAKVLEIPEKKLRADMEIMFRYRNRDWNMFRDAVKVTEKWLDRPPMKWFDKERYTHWLSTHKQELIEKWFSK